MHERPAFFIIVIYYIQALLSQLAISTVSLSVITLSLSIISVTVTLTATEKTQLTQHVTALTTIQASMDEEFNSLQFSLLVASGSEASSLQING